MFTNNANLHMGFFWYAHLTLRVSIVNTKMHLIFSTCLIFNLFLLIQSWTLSNLNISTTDQLIGVSVYYNRAFLCLRSSNNETIPSLVEASWPENSIGSRPKIFPSETQHRQKCRNVQQAKATDIDGKGRLWVVDEGTTFCAPKLFIYDLLYFNEEVSKKYYCVGIFNKKRYFRFTLQLLGTF